MAAKGGVDRAAAVRSAMLRLVARDGFHGASMGAVAKEAGVAAGTAYVHYPSKDALIVATYLQVKAALGAAVVEHLDTAAPGREQFGQVCRAVLGHLREEPDRARFLVQVDASPYATVAHAQAMAVDGDPLLAVTTGPGLAPHLVDLPAEILFDLALGPIVRLVATARTLDDQMVERLVESAWRSVTR